MADPFTTKVEEVKVSDILNSLQIALDEYDDIFSDFDTSPYTKRLISEDFLRELQARHVETAMGQVEIKFTLPTLERDTKTESTIKKRLDSYFKQQVKNVDGEIRKLRRTGAIHLIAGFVMLSSEVFLFNTTEIWLKLLTTLIVPAGWYGTYSGLEYLFDYPAELLEKKKFYERFSNAKYTFVSEEEVLQHMEKIAEAKPGSNPHNESGDQ